jgi:hypothetical protein
MTDEVMVDGLLSTLISASPREYHSARYRFLYQVLCATHSSASRLPGLEVRPIAHPIYLGSGVTTEGRDTVFWRHLNGLHAAARAFAKRSPCLRFSPGDRNWGCIDITMQAFGNLGEQANQG